MINVSVYLFVVNKIIRTMSARINYHAHQHSDFILLHNRDRNRYCSTHEYSLKGDLHPRNEAQLARWLPISHKS